LDDKKERVLVPYQATSTFPRPRFPTYSPDGKTVHYIAEDIRGNRSIWSVPTKGGEPTLRIVGDDPHMLMGLVDFDTDGKRFYFGMRINESNVWIMDLLVQIK
jgi:hypothetical protein